VEEVNHASPVDSYSRRMRIWDTDLGRNAGWIVELRGEPVALLSDPIPVDMFWFSYKITPLTTDEVVKSELFSEAFWSDAESLGLVWRSREFGDVVDAFPAASPFSSPDRLTVRGLYIVTPRQKPWDHLILWLWRKFRRFNAVPAF
jgi:hypothetical protein